MPEDAGVNPMKLFRLKATIFLPIQTQDTTILLNTCAEIFPGLYGPENGRVWGISLGKEKKYESQGFTPFG
jgi:hypothetical protein